MPRDRICPLNDRWRTAMSSESSRAGSAESEMELVRSFRRKMRLLETAPSVTVCLS